MTITIEQTKTLADAIRTADEEQIKAHGYHDVFRMLDGADNRHFDYDDLLIYAFILEPFPVADILIGIRQAINSGASGGFRPTPAQIAEHIPRAAKTTMMKLSPWQEPRALELVLKLHADGVNACDCGGAIFYYASTALYRCQECGGLDVGQLEDAEEARP
jgi:hypothetical protein